MPGETKPERAAKAEFTTPSGKVVLESLEDYYCCRLLVLQPGRYRLTVAQNPEGEDAMTADLFFEPMDGQYRWVKEG